MPEGRSVSIDEAPLSRHSGNYSGNRSRDGSQGGSGYLRQGHFRADFRGDFPSDLRSDAGRGSGLRLQGDARSNGQADSADDFDSDSGDESQTDCHDESCGGLQGRCQTHLNGDAALSHGAGETGATERAATRGPAWPSGSSG